MSRLRSQGIVGVEDKVKVTSVKESVTTARVDSGAKFAFHAGKSDVTFRNEKYFNCKHKHGLFTKSDDIQKLTRKSRSRNRKKDYENEFYDYLKGLRATECFSFLCKRKITDLEILWSLDEREISELVSKLHRENSIPKEAIEILQLDLNLKLRTKKQFKLGAVHGGNSYARKRSSPCLKSNSGTKAQKRNIDRIRLDKEHHLLAHNEGEGNRRSWQNYPREVNSGDTREVPRIRRTNRSRRISSQFIRTQEINQFQKLSEQKHLEKKKVLSSACPRGNEFGYYDACSRANPHDHKPRSPVFGCKNRKFWALVEDKEEKKSDWKSSKQNFSRKCPSKLTCSKQSQRRLNSKQLQFGSVQTHRESSHIKVKVLVKWNTSSFIWNKEIDSSTSISELRKEVARHENFTAEDVGSFEFNGKILAENEVLGKLQADCSKRKISLKCTVSQSQKLNTHFSANSGALDDEFDIFSSCSEEELCENKQPALSAQYEFRRQIQFLRHDPNSSRGKIKDDVPRNSILEDFNHENQKQQFRQRRNSSDKKIRFHQELINETETSYVENPRKAFTTTMEEIISISYSKKVASVNKGQNLQKKPLKQENLKSEYGNHKVQQATLPAQEVKERWYSSPKRNRGRGRVEITPAPAQAEAWKKSTSFKNDQDYEGILAGNLDPKSLPSNGHILIEGLRRKYCDINLCSYTGLTEGLTSDPEYVKSLLQQGNLNSLYNYLVSNGDDLYLEQSEHKEHELKQTPDLITGHVDYDYQWGDYVYKETVRNLEQEDRFCERVRRHIEKLNEEVSQEVFAAGLKELFDICSNLSKDPNSESHGSLQQPNMIPLLETRSGRELVAALGFACPINKMQTFTFDAKLVNVNDFPKVGKVLLESLLRYHSSSKNHGKESEELIGVTGNSCKKKAGK